MSDDKMREALERLLAASQQAKTPVPVKTINVSRVEKWLHEESENYHDAVGPNRRVDLLNQGREEVISALLKRLRKLGYKPTDPQASQPDGDKSQGVV